jgi:hypothetical protein
LRAFRLTFIEASYALHAGTQKGPPVGPVVTVKRLGHGLGVVKTPPFYPDGFPLAIIQFPRLRYS